MIKSLLYPTILFIMFLFVFGQIKIIQSLLKHSYINNIGKKVFVGIITFFVLNIPLLVFRNVGPQHDLTDKIVFNNIHYILYGAIASYALIVAIIGIFIQVKKLKK